MSSENSCKFCLPENTGRADSQIDCRVCGYRYVLHHRPIPGVSDKWHKRDTFSCVGCRVGLPIPNCFYGFEVFKRPQLPRVEVEAGVYE